MHSRILLDVLLKHHTVIRVVLLPDIGNDSGHEQHGRNPVNISLHVLNQPREHLGPCFRQGQLHGLALKKLPQHQRVQRHIVTMQVEPPHRADKLLQREVAGAANVDVADIPHLHNLVHYRLRLGRNRTIKHLMPSL